MLPITVVRALSPLGLAKRGDATFPGSLRPMAATLGRHAFNSPEWIYEPGWDGRRVLAEIDAGRLRLWDRDRRDVTATFPGIARAWHRFPASLVVDGEVVALDPQGLPRAGAARGVLTSHARDGDASLIYIAFDCLYLHGHPLLARPLEFRREALRALRAVLDAARVRVADPLEGVDGRILFRQSIRIGLPGVVAKRRGSVYRPGERSPDWIKIAARPREEFAVGGYVPSGRGRAGYLLVGQFDAERRLRYAGLAEIGSDELRRDLERRLKTLARKTCPFVPKPAAVPATEGARWVRPVAAAEVEYEARSSDGLVDAVLVDAWLDGG
jgi:bifunctional non-homologous end joining protein LigD